MRLLVGPGSAVTRLLASTRVDHVLTLISPDAETPSVDVPRTLLRFNDIAEPHAGLVSPNAETITTILALRESLCADAALLVHCHAGVSRSTAAAYVLACATRPAGEEQALAAFLRQTCPQATPNPLMVALADRALRRDGAMSRAIAAIGRGADAFEGAVIDWPLG